MQTQQLTQDAQARLLNINYAVSGIGLLGGIAGVIYSNRTGGGFWRGVGYYILGGVIIGITARVIAVPFENKIIKTGTTASEIPAAPTASSVAAADVANSLESVTINS
jgi:hypothetical protein